MNGQWTSLKATWLRFQLWHAEDMKEFIWINLSELVAIREYTSKEGHKQSVLVMRDNLSMTVIGWAGDRLQEVQDSQ